MFNKEALEEIVRIHPGSFPAKKLLENFHLFEQLFFALDQKWMYGCGSYLIDGSKYAYCPSMLKKQEELYRYAMSASNVLEVGTYLGHSLLLMLLANNNLKITAIDYDTTYAGPAIAFLNRIFGNRITFIHSDAVEGLKTLEHNQFDLIHIDADHHDSAVTAQFNHALPLAKENCIFVFDDYDAISKTVHNLFDTNILEKVIIPDCHCRNAITRLKSRYDSIFNICKNYSSCSKERIKANIDAIYDINSKNIPGDVVEIGVYKGGSMLAMILTNTDMKRNFWLYDTFEGMTTPSKYDIDLNNNSAQELMKCSKDIMCIASLEEVKNNINSNINISSDRITYVVGDILKNSVFPESLAVLRLDTDFYDSTVYELTHFYNLVSPGGYVIIDDYGHWKGCRKAVDEFLQKHPEIKLQTIDYTGVYFIKPF